MKEFYRQEREYKWKNKELHRKGNHTGEYKNSLNICFACNTFTLSDLKDNYKAPNMNLCWWYTIHKEEWGWGRGQRHMGAKVFEYFWN